MVTIQQLLYESFLRDEGETNVKQDSMGNRVANRSSGCHTSAICSSSVNN